MAMHSSPEKKTFQEKDQLKFTILFGHLVLSSMNATPRSSRSTSQLAWMDGWIVFYFPDNDEMAGDRYRRPAQL